MKVAITGHTNGIGKSFCNYFTERGHDIVGLSTRDGNNIRNIPKIVEQIVDCDMWINNAQSGYAQTELFLKLADAWATQDNKMIWNISTVMAADYEMPNIAGMNQLQLAEYRCQKRALEDATKTVKEHSRVRVFTIRPGAVATQPGQEPNVHGADVDAWTKTVCDFYIACRENNLFPEELSLSFKPRAMNI